MARCGTVFLAVTGVAGKVLSVEEYIFIDPFVVRRQGVYEFIRYLDGDIDLLLFSL